MADPVLLWSGFTGWDNPPAPGTTTTVTSGSVTPGTGTNLVFMLSVVSAGTSQFTSATPAGGSLTWTAQEKTSASGAYSPCSAIWTAPCNNAGSFTVAVSYGSGTSSDFSIYLATLWKVDADPTTPFGGKETTQGQAGNGAVTITLDAAPASGDWTLAQCLVDENTTNKISTFGTGTWTTSIDGTASGHQLAYNAGFRTGSTSTSVPWSDVNSGADNFGSTQAALVIKAAATNSAAITLDPFTSSASGTVVNPITVAYVKEVGFVTNTTGGTTSAITVAAGGVPTGDVVLVLGSCDNTGTNGVATTITVTDTRSNTWATLSPQAIADPGAASAGIQGFIAWTKVTTAMQAADTITVTYGNSTAAKAINAQQFTGVHTGTQILASSYATLDNGTGTAPSVATTPTANGQAVIGLVAVEGGTADSYTQDSDTTNGSWVTLTRRGSGTTTSGATLNSVYKIVTASGTQTFNPTLGTARDHAAAIVVLNVNHDGSGSPTLASFTTTTSGTVTNPAVTGTAAVTLASFTPTASGTYTPPPVTGTVAVTLDSFISAQAANYPYPVAIGSDHRLVDQDGLPFLGKGLSFWGGIMRVPESEIDDEVAAYAALGFNWINAAFCGGVDSQSDWDAVQYENEAGDGFFPGSPFQLGPSDQLGPAFDTTEHWVQAAAENGICMMLSFFVSYGTTGCRADMEAATNTHMERFGNLVGARFNQYPNIVWEIEADDSWGGGSTVAARLNAFAKGLDDSRTNYPNLWFYEPYTNAADSGKSDFQDDEGGGGWTEMHACTVGFYWYGSDHVDAIDTSFGVATGFGTRDIGSWDSEPPYAEADRYTSPSSGSSQNELLGLRQRSYSVFIRMLTGINWGHERLWPVDLTGLYPAADPADWHDVKTHTPTIEASYAWRIVDDYCTSPTWNATSSFVTSGQGTATHEVAQGASDHAALAFFPSGTTNGSTARTIVVDTTIITGTANVRLRWYDPTAGTYSTIAASEAQNASRSITLPAARGDGTRDWLLVVDDVVDGSVAQTLGVFTPSASGTVAGPSVTGTAAVTLASFTPAASGTHTPPAFTGTVAQTLGSFTPTASGTYTPPPVTGTSAQTLGDFTPTASGTHTPPAFTGTATPTLGSFTSTATGAVGQVGTATPTLGVFTPTASGTHTPPAFTGTVAVTLGEFAGVATGTFAPSGSGFGSPTLDPFTSSASGTRTIPDRTGTAAATLADFTPTASGTVTVPSFTGTGSPVLAAFTPTASGTVTSPSVDGTGSPVLALFTPSASGTVDVPAITGTVAVTLGSFVSAGGSDMGPVITGRLTLTRLDPLRTAGRLDPLRTLEALP